MGLEHIAVGADRQKSLHLTIDSDKVVTVRALGLRDTQVMLTVIASGLEAPRLLPVTLVGDTGTLSLRDKGLASYSWLSVTGYNLPSNTVGY